jgi:hypothetical protein
MAPTLSVLAAALALAAVQVLPRFIPTLEGTRRQEALSAAAGLSAAFVFLELLPQVRERADAVTGRTEGLLGFVPDEAFFLALVGLLVFYGLETLARRSRRTGHGVTDDPAGLAQISAFAGYYALIGSLLWTQEGRDLVSFSIAVGIHFLVVDYGLRAHHPVAYRRVGRWLLAAAVLVGCAVGGLAGVPEGIVGIALAFLAGAIMLITLKEELPKEAEGRFGAFAGGAAAYTVLLAVV